MGLIFLISICLAWNQSLIFVSMQDLWGEYRQFELLFCTVRNYVSWIQQEYHSSNSIFLFWLQASSLKQKLFLKKEKDKLNQIYDRILWQNKWQGCLAHIKSLLVYYGTRPRFRSISKQNCNDAKDPILKKSCLRVA